jgi:hypothetical protein
VIREDPKNPRLLYAGSEFGAFVSVDGGGTWATLGTGLPAVAVHDIIIHPREGDVIAATHGRSLWILDDVTPLQQLGETVQASNLHLFVPKTATRWRGISRGATRGHKLFMGRNPLTIDQPEPGNSPRELENSAALSFWLGFNPSEPVTIRISTLDGSWSVEHAVDAHSGLNRWFWDLRFAPSREAVEAFRARVAAMRAEMGGRLPEGFQARAPRGTEAPSGSYLVRVTLDGRSVEGILRLRDDPGLEAVLPSVR